MSDSEVNDWQDLIQSPGWQRLKDYAAHRFENGPMFKAAVRRIADGSDDVLTAKELRTLMAVQDAVEKLLNHPHERLASLGRTIRGEA